MLSQQVERVGHATQNATHLAYTALKKDEYFFADLDLQCLSFSNRNMAADRTRLRTKQLRSARHSRWGRPSCFNHHEK